MTLVSLPALALLAVGMLAALFLLPGLVLKAVAAVRRRAESPAVLGPLFWHELVTVTRRGSQVRLRVAYALILLVGLLAAFLSQFREVNPIRLLLHGGEFPRERVTAFATTFFQIFLICQLLALTIVAPVFAAGSILEEKDRGTLAFLQTSRLSNREIVLGKLAARLVFVLGLALAGLPVLALSFLIGGVDPPILATSFVAAAMSTASLAAYSVWQATRHAALKTVLANAYSLAIALFLGSGCCASCLGYAHASAISPFALLFVNVNARTGGTFDPIAATMLTVAVHGVLAGFFALLAMGNVRASMPSRSAPVRPPAPKTPRWVEEIAEPASLSASYGESRRERSPPRFVRVPPVDDEQPFLWKERYFGGKLPTFEADAMRGCGLALLVATVLPVTFGVFATAASSDRPQEILNPVFRLTCLALVAFVIPFAGARAVGCVANERQRQTLDSLFAIPVDRSLLLEAKAWAALQWLRFWVIGFGVVAAASAATGAVGIVGVLNIGLLAVVCTAFFFALAVWLSVRCAEAPRALAWYLGIAFGLYLVPPMLAMLFGGIAELLGESKQLFAAVATAAAPPFAVNEIGALPRDRRDLDRQSAHFATLFICVVYTSLSWFLWESARRRFELEGK